jgi:hypothetical protein
MFGFNGGGHKLRASLPLTVANSNSAVNNATLLTLTQYSLALKAASPFLTDNVSCVKYAVPIYSIKINNMHLGMIYANHISIISTMYNERSLS